MSTPASSEKKMLSVTDFIAKMTGATKERDEARAEVARMTAQLVVVASFLGITSEALAAKKPEELTSLLTAKAGTTQAEANNQAVKAATDAKVAAETKATAAESLTQVYVSGLAAVKITVAPAKAGEPLAAADVTGAVNARVGVLTCEKMAELGFPASGLPQSSGSADEPIDFAGKMAHYNTLTGPARDEYYARVIAPELSKKPGNN